MFSKKQQLREAAEKAAEELKEARYSSGLAGQLAHEFAEQMLDHGFTQQQADWTADTAKKYYAQISAQSEGWAKVRKRR